MTLNGKRGSLGQIPKESTHVDTIRRDVDKWLAEVGALNDRDPGMKKVLGKGHHILDDLNRMYGRTVLQVERAAILNLRKRVMKELNKARLWA